MKQINRILQIILFFSIYSNVCMDLYDDENSFNRKFIAIKDFHGKTLHVYFDAARKFEYVQRQLHFNPHKFHDFIGVIKEESFDGEFDRVDSVESIPDIDFHTIYLETKTSDKIKPTSKIIKMVVGCANQSQFKSIKTKHLKAMIAVADYFQIPREGSEYIASKLEECADDDSSIVEYMLEYGGNSPASLGEEIVNRKMDYLFGSESKEIANQCFLGAEKCSLYYSRFLYNEVNALDFYIKPLGQTPNVLWLAGKKLQNLYGINACENRD